jgi:hypothetical protein
MTNKLLLSTLLAIPLMSVIASSKSDVISAKDLSNLCQNFEPQSKGVTHIKCSKYIKGVVQGLLLVSENNSAVKSTETFTQRAIKVRLGERLINDNPQTIDAQFCIAKPYNWTDITRKVASYVDNYAVNEVSAASSVYSILQQKFPC